jgi:Tol biopolymer transport system component
LAAAVVLTILLLALALAGTSRLPRSPSALIAFGVGWDIVLVQGDGSDARRLTDDPETEWDPTWSRDGTRLAYWSDDPLPPGDTCGAFCLGAPRRLVVVDPRVGPMRPSVLTTVSNSAAWRISWSPDSRRLVVGDVENGIRVLVIVDAHTGVRSRLGTATLDGWDGAWSPDARHIVFAHGRVDPSKRSLEVIDADGANLRQLTTIRSRGAGFATPAWSPDGARIAFASETTGTDRFQRDIWTVGLDGSPEVDRSNDPADELGPTWSPDGSRLAWLREIAPGTSRFHLVVADATGAAVRVLPQVVANTPAVWSQDGTRVLAVRLSDDGRPDRLVAIDVQSGAALVVSNGVPDDVGSWQPPQR